jgi:DNA polymerase I-like protein with 3'-5' exonuclease and polymerase domains
MQIPLLRTESEWSAPESFPDLSGEPEIAIDLETYDPDLKSKGSGWPTKNGHIIGVAVATPTGAWYFPVRHETGGNLDSKRVFKWVKDVCSDPRKTYVFHNAMYDVGWLKTEGVEVAGRVIDTMIAATLIDENRFSYSLNNLGRDYLEQRKDEKLLNAAASEWGVDAKAEMYKLPPQYVGPYAEQDAALTLRLWELFKGLIIKEEIQDIFELELRVLRAILKMRERGVRVDCNKADEINQKLEQEERALIKKIKDETGVSVDIWAAASVSKAFDSAGLKYPVTGGTGAPSFTKHFLTTHEHDLPKLIVRARELNKARTTFIEAIMKHQHNGRIHADIHQLRSDEGGTITGRFSYSNPNLQQIPSRDEVIGPMIRSLFLPEEGCEWGAFDYSSQEPRIVVHYASLMGYDRADEFVRKYREDAGADFHQIAADIVGVPRKQAKTINLGLFYGMGVTKLSNQLGLDLDKGKELFARYHQEVPFVKELSDYASDRASKRGVIRTLLGRKIHYDKWEPAKFGIHKPLSHKDAFAEYGAGIRRAFTYKALNSLIQGSAADQTKKALVDLADEGILPMIQIHDELALTIPDRETAFRAKEIMENCVELEIPSLVDAELGPSWGEATRKLK